MIDIILKINTAMMIAFGIGVISGIIALVVEILKERRNNE